MSPDSEALLEKAKRSIASAGRVLEDGDADFAASRAYYAMFYTAEALLAERGLRFRKHAAVHSAFGQHFAQPRELDPKFHRWMLEAFAVRIEGDYGFRAEIEPDEVVSFIAQADEFLAAARTYLEANA